MNIEMLGNELRKMRKAKKLPMREVAAKSGYSQGYISQLERGDIAEPGVKALNSILAAMGESLIDFLTMLEQKKTPKMCLSASLS